MVITLAKTTSCTYENHLQLLHFIKENELHAFPSLLIQIFSGIVDQSVIKEVQDSLQALVPQAVIIGCTTAGEIMSGTTGEQTIVLSFTSFEKTTLKSILLDLENYTDSFTMGKKLAGELISIDTKAMILFTGDFQIDCQQLLDGIHTTSSEVLLSGGIAGDNGKFESGYVFNENCITSTGAVAVVLNNQDLIVETGSNFKWREIGKRITVTKSTGRIIYGLDDRKPLQILKQYLGEAFVNDLPKSGTEFPFIIDRNGERVSVFISKVLEQGAIEVNRSIATGEQLTFAYPDIASVIDNSLSAMKRLSRKTVESIFVYNCMARKHYMRDFSNAELEMLQTIAPTDGFFSYGEVYSIKKKNPHIIGHSLTFLAISEDAIPKKREAIPSFEYTAPDNLNSIISLTHLMQASQNDTRILNENLALSGQYYRSLFDNNTDFVYSTDLNGHFTSVNRSFEKTFGYSESDVLGKSAMKFIKEVDIPRAKGHFIRALKGKEQSYNLEIANVKGEVQLFQMKNIPITVNGEAIGLYGIGRNITEQKKIEEKITQLAYYDYQTGLPNRLKITEQLDEMIKRVKKKKRLLSVLFIDVDRFKIINDSLGHSAGDVILKEIASRIKKELPSGAYFGRFSGDKFTLILTKNVTREEVLKMAESIIQCISEPFFFEQKEFFVTASVGVSLFPHDGSEEQELFKNADIAMNLSKHSGGNQITFFSTEMNEQALMRLELESYLRKALQKDEFFLCYQPLIDLATGNLYGSEALIRWDHPKMGLVSPGDFIPLAEETGLIDEIGAWVLRTACIQNKKWHDLGLGEITISINVSAYQFQKPDFLIEVQNALHESGLEPKYLTLELTESAMLRNIEYSIMTMKALREMGVMVSIDDFGTGYSSLSYLRNLPINTLKIDRSFINNLKVDTSDIAIVKAIITMGQGLSVKVVAEGVETKEQIELLKELQCHYAQGFYLHKPLLSADFENRLNKNAVLLS